MYEMITVNGVVILPNDTLDIVCQISELEQCKELVREQTGDVFDSKGYRHVAPIIAPAVEGPPTAGVTMYGPKDGFPKWRPKNAVSVQSSDGEQFVVDEVSLVSKSAVFREVLERQRRPEQRRNFVVVVDDARAETVAAMLSFVETGLLPQNESSTIVALLPVADKYQIDGLKESCEEILESSMNDDNAASMLIAATRSNASRLRRNAVRLIASKVDALCGELDDDLMSVILAEIVGLRRH